MDMYDFITEEELALGEEQAQIFLEEEKEKESKAISKRVLQALGFERIIRKELQERYGIFVCTLKTFDRKLNKSVLNIEYIDEFFELNDVSKEEETKLRTFFDSNPNGLPDLMCIKDGIIFFVEIKSGTGKLRPSQKKTIPRLIEKGYKVFLRKENWRDAFWYNNI